MWMFLIPECYEKYLQAIKPANISSHIYGILFLLLLSVHHNLRGIFVSIWVCIYVNSILFDLKIYISKHCEPQQISKATSFNTSIGLGYFQYLNWENI